MRRSDNQAQTTAARISGHAELAQSVEHLHGKEGVGGSNPPLGFNRICSQRRIVLQRRRYKVVATTVPATVRPPGATESATCNVSPLPPALRTLARIRFPLSATMLPW
jgi:hypothetical protein